MALTPCPDQLPAMPLWVVGKAMAAAFEHKEAGTPEITGVVDGLTVMVVVATSAHCPAFGVNESVTLPLRPAGLKLLLVTPSPDQLPTMPLCTVGSAMGAAVWQMEAGTPEIGGAVAVFTVMVVVAGATQAWLEVKVSGMLPLSPIGLKLVPFTPVPLQVPLG